MDVVEFCQELLHIVGVVPLWPKLLATLPGLLSARRKLGVIFIVKTFIDHRFRFIQHAFTEFFPTFVEVVLVIVDCSQWQEHFSNRLLQLLRWHFGLGRCWDVQFQAYYRPLILTVRPNVKFFFRLFINGRIFFTRLTPDGIFATGLTTALILILSFYQILQTSKISYL
jgi:hypothetical protein